MIKADQPKIHFHKKETPDVFCLHEESTPYLSFCALDRTGLFLNAFSTRLGGVSEGCLSTMNLTYGKAGDTDEHVLENFRRIASAVGFDLQKTVVSHQTHTVNIREATETDFGKGVLRGRDYTDVDGLVTNVPGLTLVTFYADCVPLYIADPVHRAIGLSHSGWRGTVNRIGARTIERMQELYGSRPSDLICCIGPSICRDCFEIGPEVAEEFDRAFERKYRSGILFARTAQGQVVPLQGSEEITEGKKYYADLWEANVRVFLSCGVSAGNIHVTNICTHCNPTLLWSHRTQGTKRGNLAAFFSIVSTKPET